MRCLGKAFQLFVADGFRLLYEVTDPRGYVGLDLNRKLPYSLQVPQHGSLVEE
jgi:hypothetical protein